MKFNEIVLNKIEVLFQKENLYLSEQFKNYLKFKSNNRVVVICRNERENSNLLYVGRTNDTLYLIDTNIIKKFFISDLENNYWFPESNVDNFINNVFGLFSGKGRELLKEDSTILSSIEEYIKVISKAYTEKLTKK